MYSWRCVGRRSRGDRESVDSEAASFWRRRGFLQSKDDPLVLFRSIVDVAASLDRASGQSEAFINPFAITLRRTQIVVIFYA
jgi:hypothetical protein